MRHTGRATPLGTHFDGEVDAFLIAVLSVYVAPDRRACGCSRSGRRVTRSTPPAGCCRGCVHRCRGATGAGSSPRFRASCWPSRLPTSCRSLLTQAVLLAALALLVRIVRPRRRVAVGPPQRHARSGGEDRGPGGCPRSRRSRRPAARARARRSRRTAHDPRPARGVGRPRRSEPAWSSDARRVRESCRSKASSSSPWPSCFPPTADVSWRASSGRCSACWSS